MTPIGLRFICKVSHYDEYICIIFGSKIYSTLIAIVVKLISSYAVVDFHLFCNGAVKCSVSATQVTVKVCGLLVLRSDVDQRPLTNEDHWIMNSLQL